MNQIRVVSVGDTSAAVVAALEARPTTVRIVRRCVELAELLAVCQSGIAHAAFIATPSPELTSTLIDRLTAVGVCVIAVSATPAETRRLQGIGAVPLPEDATAELLTQSVHMALEARRHGPVTGFAFPGSASWPATTDDAGNAPSATRDTARAAAAGDGNAAITAAAAGPVQATPNAATSNPAAPAAPVAAAAAEPLAESAAPRAAAAPASKRMFNKADRRWFIRGRRAKMPSRRPGKISVPGNVSPTLMAVWGPIGSPGRTTVAINLAAEYAVQGKRVLLVDADSYGASIAAALGLLDESASFAQACRVADQGTLSVASLAKTTTQVVFAGGTFSLLTGLTRADRWPELRAAAVERVLNTALDLAELVIVDCGFSLENDEELSYDTVAPRRNAATLTVLAQADVIFAVGNGDTLGIPRLIRGLAELAQTPTQAQLRVVVNKVRRKAVGGSAEKALEQAWQRFGPGIPISYFLPWDPELTDRALLEGRLLLEVAPEAPLTRAIRVMSCADDQQKSASAGSRSTARARLHS